MNTRRANNVASASSLLLLLLIGAAIAPASASQSIGAGPTADPPQPDLLSHGTDQMYWIARVQTPRASDKSSQYTTIRGRQVGDARWTDVGRLAARVVSIANRGGELAVLLEGGEWTILWPGGNAMGASPPDGARLMTFGSSPASLWAIGVGGRAMSATSATNQASPGGPSTVSAADQSYDRLGLYKLERGTWKRQAPLPNDLDIRSSQSLSLAVVNAQAVLASLQVDGGIRVVRWNDRAAWDDLGRVRADDVVQFRLLGGLEAPVLWLAPARGAGQLYFYGANGWSQPVPLKVEGQVPSAAARTIAVVGQNIRMAFVAGTKGEQLFEQTFARDGQPVGKLSAIPELLTQTDPLPLRWLTTAAAAMLMIVVISSVRRGPPPADAIAGIRPAPLTLRFMAGVIDALPIAIAMFLLSREVKSPNPTVEELMAAVGYPFYISLGIYLLHTWLSEQFFGRTLGKAIFGLRVATIDGNKPGAGAICARNLLRLVDVMIVVPLLLVVFSPLRQRVGDIAARTVVIVDTPGEVEKDDEATE